MGLRQGCGIATGSWDWNPVGNQGCGIATGLWDDTMVVRDRVVKARVLERREELATVNEVIFKIKSLRG